MHTHTLTWHEHAPAPCAEADCKCTGFAASQLVPTFASPFYAKACGAIAKPGNPPTGTLTQCQRYQFTGKQKVSECLEESSQGLQWAVCYSELATGGWVLDHACSDIPKKYLIKPGEVPGCG